MNKRGFTLVEILIAILILGIVLTTIYGAYMGTFRVIRIADADDAAYRMARTAMDRMIRDFNSLTPAGGKFVFSASRSDKTEEPFVSLKFLSSAHVGFGADENSPAGTYIAYTVQESPQSGTGYILWRNDIPLNSGSITQIISEEGKTGGFILCEGLKSLDFKFYDNQGNMYETWDSTVQGGAMEGVVPSRIDVFMSLVKPDDPDHPYIFMTSIFIPVNKVNRESQVS
ncbi:MAG: prepilin-type N-terminal cleavage/methylation domain-containing protein [Syntrophales bacterium]